MKRKNRTIIFLATILILGWVTTRTIKQSETKPGSTTKTSTVRFITSTMTADGSIVAQNQARLAFQTSGKLTYLPFKEGDKVRAGQTIAKLDSYALQRQLRASLNNYRSTRDTFDQVQQNNIDNVLNAQVTPTYAKANLDTTQAVNDAIKRILDQNQATLDNSVINVELANYALQLSTLSSPISGIITHEDVAVAGLNITPATGFTVADPDSMVFRANIPTSSIYYVSLGSKVTLVLDGINQKISGTVSRIYPSKIILSGGQAVYPIDIVSDELKTKAKLEQTGKAIISTNSENLALVPVWSVLSGKYIWINNNDKPELRQVSTGKIHGNEIEITAGLAAGDKIIVDPKYISSLKYPIL